MAFRWRWYHGVALYAGVTVAERAMRACAGRLFAARPEREDRAADRARYETQRLPVFAPPGIAFPIAWSINAVSQIAGLLHVANLPPQTPGRSAYLRGSAAMWTLYATFDAAYFGLRSPVNAAAVTFLYTTATLATLAGARRTGSPLATGSLATTLLWLALANPVAVTQLLWNRDPFWNVGPFADPPAALLKPAR